MKRSQGATATPPSAAVVNVSPAFEAAIRAAARAAVQEAAWMHIGAEGALAAREAVSEHVRTKVRAAARELIRTETGAVAHEVGTEAPAAAGEDSRARGPRRRNTRRGFR